MAAVSLYYRFDLKGLNADITSLVNNIEDLFLVLKRNLSYKTQKKEALKAFKRCSGYTGTTEDSPLQVVVEEALAGHQCFKVIIKDLT